MIIGAAWSTCARPGQRQKLLERREEQRRQAMSRLQAKQQIVSRLILGSLSLLDASAQFAALSSEEDPPDQDAERLCRQVIGWVHLTLLQQDRPERAEAFSLRLEQEQHLHLTRNGGAVRLRCA